MELVITAGDIVAAGGLRGEEVRAFQQHVLVVALFRLTHTAERRGPAAEAGADVTQHRSLDLVAKQRAAADDGEVLLAPLRLEQEVVGNHAVVVQSVEADRVAYRAKAVQVGDVPELRPALVVLYFEKRSDE